MADNRFITIIKSNQSWFYFDWKGFVQYRDLLFLLVRRDFFSKFKQSVLGPLWFIIQPLVMTIIFNVVFNKVAKIPTDNIPPMLFYFGGLVIWQYFSTSLSKNATSFVTNKNLFDKVYFPRLIVPVSVLISNMISLSIQFVTFVCFLLYFKFYTPAGEIVQPNLFIFLFPLIVLYTGMVSLGVSLWISALTSKYRDLAFAMQFLVRIWMYATPVIYPMSLVPDKWKILVAINPMTIAVESFRYIFLGQGVVDPKFIILGICITSFFIVSGVLLFNKVERTVMDTV